MRKFLFLVWFMALCTQACKSNAETDLFQENEIDEAELYCKISARLPSDEQCSDTRVLLEGDAPSSPIVLKWQGSTSAFRDRFAILGYDDSGNIAYITDAIRLATETDNSPSGTFEFTIDRAHWIDDLEFDTFRAFYPYRQYDDMYYSGSDDDKDNWVFRFSEQSGYFGAIPQNLFMTCKSDIDLDNPQIEFQYGIAILRLSGLRIPDLKGQTVSGIKLKSNAIRDAISYRWSISDYYAAGNEISITGDYFVNNEGVIEDNIYIVFSPSSDPLDYLSLSVTVNGSDFCYSYPGEVNSFSVGKVYTLKNAVLSYKDNSPEYDWYLNPVGENRYLLSSARDFLAFQKIVNGDEDALMRVGINEADKFESKTIDFVVGTTIDLSEVLNPGENWTPINGFKGTINGNGAIIKNLFIGGAFRFMGAKIGLFETLESARISSLNVSGTIDARGAYNGHIAGLAAYVLYSSILNCTSEMILSHSDGYGNKIGGLVGSALYSNIIGCCDMSRISIKTATRDTDYVGGIVGYITGRTNNTIACSHMTAELSVTDYSYVGGVIGGEGRDNLSLISACFNSGKISPYSGGSGGAGGQIHAGCGRWDSSFNISSCYYSGESGSGIRALCGVGRADANSFDSGTQRVKDEEEMIVACEDMNSKIDEWNTSNPTQPCSRRYYVENKQIVFY